MANGEMITKDDAKTMIDAYQDEFPSAVKAHLFDADLINNLLTDTDTDAIRIYHALDSDDVQKLVLVCVDSNGKDLDNNYILERGTICPPNCDANSYFNS